MKNQFKQPDIKEEDEYIMKDENERIRGNKFSSFFQSFFGGGILTKKSIIKSIPFYLFLTALAILYIYNNNLAEKKIIKIEKLKKELIELRYEYISSKSNMMDSLKQSLVIEKLETIGIKESNTAPKKIFIKTDKKFDN